MSTESKFLCEIKSDISQMCEYVMKIVIKGYKEGKFPLGRYSGGVQLFNENGEFVARKACELITDKFINVFLNFFPEEDGNILLATNADKSHRFIIYQKPDGSHMMIEPTVNQIIENINKSLHKPSLEYIQKGFVTCTLSKSSAGSFSKAVIANIPNSEDIKQDRKAVATLCVAEMKYYGGNTHIIDLSPQEDIKIQSTELLRSILRGQKGQGAQV